MKIPSNSHPTYEILIPSLNKKFKFRPFLMKENKALMLAQVSEDDTIILNTLKEVVKSCCLDEIDVSKLAIFDFEFILCHLRSISVGNRVVLRLECDGESEAHDANPESREANVVLNLENVEVSGIDSFTYDLHLSPELMVHMKPPFLEDFIKHRNEENTIEKGMRIVANQIDKIYTKEETIECSEHSTEEIIEWIESLTLEQYEILASWFANIPEAVIKVEWDCPTCGKHNVRLLKGFLDFFA